MDPVVGVGDGDEGEVFAEPFPGVVERFVAERLVFSP